MAYNYGYGAEGTIINGFLNWVSKNHSTWYEANIKRLADLNSHLVAIRKSIEPDKPVANTAEKNAIYISNNLGFKVVKQYFKNLTV